MAKYDVTYACGHTGVVSLFGPNKDRERKLEWLAGQLCPACWGEKKRAEEAAKPVTATLYCNGLDESPDGDLIGWVVLTGGTMPVKDKIKAIGYHWGEVRGGVMDMLSADKPRQAWQRAVKMADILNQTSVWRKEVEALKDIGAQFAMGINDIDIMMIRERIAEKARIAEAVAAIKKPEKPACHPTGRWNGKIYGGGRIYVDGEEVRLTTEEAESLKKYLTDIDAYRKAVEEAKRSAK